MLKSTLHKVTKCTMCQLARFLAGVNMEAEFLTSWMASPELRVLTDLRSDVWSSFCMFLLEIVGTLTAFVYFGSFSSACRDKSGKSRLSLVSLAAYQLA